MLLAIMSKYKTISQAVIQVLKVIVYTSASLGVLEH